MVPINIIYLHSSFIPYEAAFLVLWWYLLITTVAEIDVEVVMK